MRDGSAIENDLQAARTEADLFFQFIPSILIGLDIEGNITEWNLSAAKNRGIAAENVKGQPVYACGIHWLDPNMENEVKRWLTTEDVDRPDDLSFMREEGPGTRAKCPQASSTSRQNCVHCDWR